MNKQSQNTAGVLIVDDEQQIRTAIDKVLTRDGHVCFHASEGQEALNVLEREHVDVVITDITMPGMDGISLTKKIREDYDQDVILMTGYIKDISYGDAIARGGSDFIQKPFDLKEVLIRINRVLRERAMRFKLKEALEQTQQIMDGMIQTLSYSVEARDPYTSGHQSRVAELAAAIGRQMGLSQDRVIGIRMAGEIHDLGKIAIPSGILSKPSKLSDAEFQLLKAHPQTGYDILKNIRFPFPIADIVYQHHERMNGSGYPKGLPGSEILVESRITAVADVVEAMSSHRPYRPALGTDTALEEIKNNSGTLFDSDAVTACLKVIHDKKVILDS